MTFASRADAGRKLGAWLLDRRVQPDVVLGLPRGGVVVAAEVANVLHRPLDALVVRKIGHPHQREYAVGALAEHGVILLDEAAMAETSVRLLELEEVIAGEIDRVREYQSRFHPNGSRDLSGLSVLIVDDGLATGATTEAAVKSARKQMAREVVVAAPVASPQAVSRLERSADAVLVMEIDPEFTAVGQYYEEFEQTKDEEVEALLNAAACHSH